ncbi:unnamed protein product [Pieris macdunnoughi]|uniref:Cuticle protein n=1 Tax=Pieris macdunnoughi TaxID=345717 RepID=A0A821PTA8_9NEOP|nr:unnamed protein product [Pieris macdunnoughi]
MKYILAISCLLALSGPARANGLEGLVYAPGHASADYYAYPSYAFEYAVRDPHTGDNKAQWEKRDGDVVTGAYSLVEPDGSIRVVEYRADDKSGFNAVVKRIGPNLHPESKPIYKAPIPTLGYAAAPLTVGPVAGLGGLSSAPYYSKPYSSGAYSSASIYKSAIPAVVKEVLPIPRVVPAPIYPAPAPIPPAPLPAPLPLPIPLPSLHPAPYLPRQRIPIPEPIPYGPLGGYDSLGSNYLYSSPLSYH